MEFDKEINDGNLKIYCSNDLENFANEFIVHFNKKFPELLNYFEIKDDIKIIVALTDKKEEAGFVYGKSGFSGFFTNTGAFAYINLNGNRSKEYMLKGLINELVHYIYKYYVYGEDKEKITWVDEGLAQLFSEQKSDLNDKNIFRNFINDNLKNVDNINLNVLNHNDLSFGNNNGYNLSYIAIRYLFENNNKEDFLELIKNHNELKNIGTNIIELIKNKYDRKVL